MASSDDKRGGHILVGPPGDQSMVAVSSQVVDGVRRVRVGQTLLSVADARKLAAMLLYAAGGMSGEGDDE
jgi:hypothetical protein